MTKAQRTYCHRRQGLLVDGKPVLAKEQVKETDAQIYWAVQGDTESPRRVQVYPRLASGIEGMKDSSFVSHKSTSSLLEERR